VEGDDDVYINVADDMVANMAMMWKVVLTWKVTSAPHPICGWAKIRLGH